MKSKKKKATKKKYKKNFNTVRINNPDRKYVTDIKPLWWKLNKLNQLNEKSLKIALSAFLGEDCNINGDRKKLKGSDYTIFPDYVVTLKDTKKPFTAWNKKERKTEQINGVIFEYDGDKHYYSMLKIESDNIKMKEIAKLKYRRIRIPFYYQLTKSIAKFIFDDLMFHFAGKKYFDENKYYEAIKKIYRDPITGKSLEKKSKNELKNMDYGVVYSPGMSLSEYVPATFHDYALRRFINDFKWKSNRPGSESKGFPESAKHQIFRSLQLYIKDTKINESEEKKYLILPTSGPRKFSGQKSDHAKEFMVEYEKFENGPKVNEYFDEVFYLREEYSNLR